MAEEYLDEVILKKRREKDKAKVLAYVREHPELPESLFQTLCIGEGMAQVKLPIGLVPLPEELVRKRFLYDPQPQIVMTNKKGDVTFGFSVLDVAISDGKLDVRVGEIREGLRKFWPTAVFYGRDQEDVNGIPVSWFSYVTNSLDGFKLYHVACYAAMERTLLMTMDCRYEQMEKWNAVAELCRRSLTGKGFNG